MWFFQNPEIFFYHWQLFNTFYSDTQIRYHFANGLSSFVCFANGLSSFVHFVSGLWSFVSFANGLSSFIHFASVLSSFVCFPMVCRLSFFAVLSPDNGPSCCFHYYCSSTISKTISSKNTLNPIWPIFIEFHIKYQQEENASCPF